MTWKVRQSRRRTACRQNSYPTTTSSRATAMLFLPKQCLPFDTMGDIQFLEGKSSRTGENQIEEEEPREGRAVEAMLARHCFSNRLEQTGTSQGGDSTQFLVCMRVEVFFLQSALLPTVASSCSRSAFVFHGCIHCALFPRFIPFNP